MPDASSLFRCASSAINRLPLLPFIPHRLSSKRTTCRAILGLTVLCSLSAHAALPDSIQAALVRAQLSPDTVSMMVTPVGKNQASRLPPSVQVIDSTPSADKAPDTSDTATKPPKIAPDVSTPNLIIVEKRVITQKERTLHAYTDDPYTYQSLESTPSIVPMGKSSADAASSPHVTTKTDTSSVTPLISHNPLTARTPASTMKLIPSFIALDMLGADFVWQTRVYHTGLVIGDRLHGDLLVQGSGDPKMTHERLEQLLYHVQKSGIRHINGDIIVDSSIFQQVTKDPAAFDRAPLRPYNASPDGFLVNFSSMGIKSQPLDEQQAQLTYTPQLANYQMPDKISTRAGACGQASYSLAPSWQADKLLLNAALPSSCGEHVFYVAYPDAKDFAARVLKAKWQALGNTISGQVVTQESPYQRPNSTAKRQGLSRMALSPLPIVSYPSLTLKQQIYDINHFSNNVMTEQVALSIGAYHAPKVQSHTPSDSSLYQFGAPRTTDYAKALSAMNEWWQTNLNTKPPHLTNGSGLCRECTLSAANLNELLHTAYQHPSFDAYVNSLGIAGVSGTIAAHSERLPTSAAIGRAWIKTGTLNNVTAMAGYVKGQSGQDYTVVGLINTDQPLNPYLARPVLDAMLDWTAKQ